MTDKFYSLNSIVENTIVIEKSKFICTISPIKDETEAKLFIERIKRQYPFATHNCYGYIADENANIRKFSDDGEPQGTAGSPIIEALKVYDMRKVVAVVTRYFGGIKLGVGGLTRAYYQAVSECLSKADKVLYKFGSLFQTEVSYSVADKFIRFLSDSGFLVCDKSYSDNVQISFTDLSGDGNEDKRIKQLNEFLQSRYPITFIKKDYFTT